MSASIVVYEDNGWQKLLPLVCELVPECCAPLSQWILVEQTPLEVPVVENEGPVLTV